MRVDFKKKLAQGGGERTPSGKSKPQKRGIALRRRGQKPRNIWTRSCFGGKNRTAAQENSFSRILSAEQRGGKLQRSGQRAFWARAGRENRIWVAEVRNPRERQGVWRWQGMDYFEKEEGFAGKETKPEGNGMPYRLCREGGKSEFPVLVGALAVRMESICEEGGGDRENITRSTRYVIKKGRTRNLTQVREKRCGTRVRGATHLAKEEKKAPREPSHQKASYESAESYSWGKRKKCSKNRLPKGLRKKSLFSSVHA